MKRFGTGGARPSGGALPSSEIRGYILGGTPPTLGGLGSTSGASAPTQCNTSECKHHHENIKLKEVLNSSLKDGNKMMMESTRVVNSLKEEYEKAHSILLEENDILTRGERKATSRE